ncbi:hypothetical protein SARC_09660, partial [Sphaeroforma arctica JP610]
AQVYLIQKQTALIGDDSKEAAIRKTREEGRALARQIGSDVKDLVRSEQSAPTNDNIRRIKLAKLKTDFTDVLRRYEAAEREAGEKERDVLRIARQSQDSAGRDEVLIDIDGDDDQNDAEPGALPLSRRERRSQDMRNSPRRQQRRNPQTSQRQQQPYAPPARQTQQQMQAQMELDMQLDDRITYNERTIAQREQGITEIEQTIEEVNSLFQDLGALVHEQGHMLDNIESNIVSASDTVEEAHEQVLTAEGYQKSSQTRMCYMLYFFLAILGLVVLILLLTLA